MSQKWDGLYGKFRIEGLTCHSVHAQSKPDLYHSAFIMNL